MCVILRHPDTNLYYHLWLPSSPHLLTSRKVDLVQCLLFTSDSLTLQRGHAADYTSNSLIALLSSHLKATALYCQRKETVSTKSA